MGNSGIGNSGIRYGKRAERVVRTDWELENKVTVTRNEKHEVWLKRNRTIAFTSLFSHISYHVHFD